MKLNAKSLLLGVAIGDALGVPYEFVERKEMKKAPAMGMIGFKSHNQPPGTWSDDSSLTFCLAESLLEEYSLLNTSKNFIRWKNDAWWTAHDEVFDIGTTTSKAISRLQEIIISRRYEELKSLNLSAEESENGNGSLMRILPLVYEINGMKIKQQFEFVWQNSALTHRHIRAAMSCMIYLRLTINLIKYQDKARAYLRTKLDILRLWDKIDFPDPEKKHFNRIIENDLFELKAKNLKSNGYVIDSLEASLWSFLTTNSYQEAVLTAVNLGHDTDTTGAITGGIAGLYYGFENIPERWIISVARLKDILQLGDRLNQKYGEYIAPPSHKEL